MEPWIMEKDNIQSLLIQIEGRLSELEKRSEKTKVDKFFDGALKVVLPTVIAIGSFAFSMHDRITTLEQNSPNKYEYQANIIEIKSEISKLRDSNQWVRDAFTKIDTKLDSLTNAVDNLKERVIKLETLR